jgi:hypothetical protein
MLSGICEVGSSSVRRIFMMSHLMLLTRLNRAWEEDETVVSRAFTRTIGFAGID